MNYLKGLKQTCIVLVLLSLTFVGCKKYEEGPTFSLRSKKERIANTWVPVKALQDGKEMDNSTTINYGDMVLELTKKGDAEISLKIKIGNLDTKIEGEGTWEFEDNKEKLKLDFDRDEFDATVKILRLKEKELWLLYEDDKIELRMEPK